MRFNKAKSKVLHLGQGSLWYQYRLEEGGVESSPAEDLELLVGEKLDTTWHGALAAQRANLTLDFQKKCGSRVRLIALVWLFLTTVSVLPSEEEEEEDIKEEEGAVIL
ncbi:hypothetical protein TURU_106433 [Turdus rufiventris]|nr:hypothetical protein TURU_106433 [Turdus rufiventris]